jgi:basic membrane protein A
MLVLPACSADERRDQEPAAERPAETARVEKERTPPPLRVALVLHGKPSVAASARDGIERAEQDLGVDARVVTIEGRRLRGPLQDAAAGSDVVFAAGGPRLRRAVAAVAAQEPKTHFALIDASHGDAPAPNVRGLRFADEQAGYLAGYLAGLVLADEGGRDPAASLVGGRAAERIDRPLAGFRAGVRAAAPETRVLLGYADSLDDPAACKQLALRHIARGARVVFAVADDCTSGALEAAEEKNVRAVGAAADADHVLATPVKNADVAVLDTIRRVRLGTFSGGEDTVYDASSGGVGLGEIDDTLPTALVMRVKRVEADLAFGRLRGIPTSVRNSRP